MICGNNLLKMQLLKERANKVLRDDFLRHIPNEHDIKECSDNTKLFTYPSGKNNKITILL